MTEYIIHRDKELRHYGVKGTHWGVRRYQNEDGSYKPGAEGRYYQPVKGQISGSKKNVSTTGGGTSASPTKTAAKKMLSARELHASRGSVIEEGKKKTSEASGGGGGAPEEKKENEITTKTRSGKEIELKDVSQKKNYTTGSSSKGSGSSSTKKEQEKKEGDENFKLTQFTDKIDNLFREDENWEEVELDQADIDAINDLVTKYRKWREGNKSKTAQTKKIDAFIEAYQAWLSNHGKKAEHSAMKETYLQHFGILGMHWGIRRYQNPDGSYTEAGKKRYQKEVQRNHQKSKKNRVDDTDLKDPDRWVKEDLSNAKQVADASRTMTNELKNLEQNTRSKKENPRLDLSNMSDKELRDRINRELLEQQYNNMFNKTDVSRGRENVQQALSLAGSVLGVASSALAIAIAIRELKK